MATSPCVGICKLDPTTQICIGCRRTIAEIAAWPNLSEAERIAIVQRLEETSRAEPG